jgi:beta-glucuronidase
MKTVSLDGNWKCKPDLKNEGIENEWYSHKNFNLKDKDLIDIKIPNSFNLLEGYEIYEGIFWHFFQFNLDSTDIQDTFDYVIKFKGSNYISKVWLNGIFLGEFHGGFTPFTFTIKDRLKPNSNLLVVRTDNTRRKNQIPGYTADWLNWGGIYRSVDLQILNKNRITDVVIKTVLKSRKESIVSISYKIIGKISLNWQILDTDQKTLLYEGNISETLGEGNFSLTINNPKLWAPDTPDLYYIKILSTLPVSRDESLFKSHFGIRQIEISGIYVYLNKRKFYFKGISLHEEYMPYGRTIPYEKREEDVKNIKSLGLNAIRTAHYSHDEDLIEIADKLGILILEEIPVYWSCDFKSNETFKVAAKQMRNLIKRDINHPSVVWWSAGNEVPIEKRECSIFFKRLMDWARRLDDTRIVTFVSHRMFCDLTKRYADVGAINMYFGWYYGSPKMINTVIDIIHTPIFNKPLFYTEFGAGAKYGFHVDWKEQTKFSEERQLYVLDYTIRTLNSKNYIAGWFIWIYRDFRAFLRQNQYQEGFNRKGIVSGEKNEKKLMYYRLPNIIDEKRPIKSSKLLARIMWCIIFPFAFMVTYIIDFIMAIGKEKRMDSGKKKDQLRLNKKRRSER